MSHYNDSRRYDYLGKSTEYLTVIAYDSYCKKIRKHYWIAKCHDCGNEFKLHSGRVKTQKSCGCVSSMEWQRRRQKANPKIEMPATIESSELSKNLLRKKWI